MSTQTYDWTRFKKQIFIQAEKENVFQAWATPEKIVQWFIADANYTTAEETAREATELVAVGDSYHWRWHQDLEAQGDIVEVVENERLRFTFGNKKSDSDEKIMVTVQVKEVANATLLELTQENMAVSDQAQVYWHMGCNLGWSFFMTNLKGLLEHGIDLRETDPERAYASRAISH
ncbi:MAG: SRPBCC domain-containing protein [Chloroflexota bacterium]